MRACFLGQNVCALGNGIAILQTPRVEDVPDKVDEEEAHEHLEPPAPHSSNIANIPPKH